MELQFVCLRCGRTQARCSDTDAEGVTRDEALIIGWQCDPVRADLWLCPFCACSQKRCPELDRLLARRVELIESVRKLRKAKNERR